MSMVIMSLLVFFSISVECQSVARHSVPPEKVAEPRKDIFYSFPSSLESRLIRLSAAFGTESKSFSTEAAKSPFPMKHFQRFLLLWQWFMQNTTETPTATRIGSEIMSAIKRGRIKTLILERPSVSKASTSSLSFMVPSCAVKAEPDLPATMMATITGESSLHRELVTPSTTKILAP